MNIAKLRKRISDRNEEGVKAFEERIREAVSSIQINPEVKKRIWDNIEQQIKGGKQ